VYTANRAIARGSRSHPSPRPKFSSFSSRWFKISMPKPMPHAFAARFALPHTSQSPAAWTLFLFTPRVYIRTLTVLGYRYCLVTPFFPIRIQRRSNATTLPLFCSLVIRCVSCFLCFLSIVFFRLHRATSAARGSGHMISLLSGCYCAYLSRVGI